MVRHRHVGKKYAYFQLMIHCSTIHYINVLHTYILNLKRSNYVVIDSLTKILSLFLDNFASSICYTCSNWLENQSPFKNKLIKYWTCSNCRENRLRMSCEYWTSWVLSSCSLTVSVTHWSTIANWFVIDFHISWNRPINKSRPATIYFLKNNSVNYLFPSKRFEVVDYEKHFAKWKPSKKSNYKWKINMMFFH